MTKDFTTLSLDLGKTFGWALGKNGIITHSGEVCLEEKGDTHPGMVALRFQNFLHDFRGVDEVLYEKVTGGRSFAAGKSHGGLLYQLYVFVLQHGIRSSNITAKGVKGLFTGNGNASKEMMCEVACKLGWKNGKIGTDLKNNECDAIALMWVVFVKRGLEPKFAEVDTQAKLSL